MKNFRLFTLLLALLLSVEANHLMAQAPGLKMAASSNQDYLLMNMDNSSHFSKIQMRTSAHDWKLVNRGPEFRFIHSLHAFPNNEQVALTIKENGDLLLLDGAEIKGFRSVVGSGFLFLKGSPSAGQGITLSGYSDNVMVTGTLSVGTPRLPVTGTQMTVDGRMHVSAAGGTQVTFNEEEYGDYLLWIDGGIVGENFAVANSDDWADFVFEDDYQLPSLTSIETFISQNGHLPTIPSEEEVKEGYSQHEMSKNFTQTLEELMLHTVSQGKQIKSLAKRLTQLEK
jgi:hypothetical protein